MSRNKMLLFIFFDLGLLNGYYQICKIKIIVSPFVCKLT